MVPKVGVRPLAERWNGRTWAVQPTAVPPTAGRGTALTFSAGVSCTAADACVAAGVSSTKNSVRLLTEGWNGTAWTVQPLAAPAHTALPVRISCTWRKDCMVVGLQGAGRVLAEHWNGRTWSVLPTERQGALVGVSCRTHGDCVAVGFSLLGQGLAEHWNGQVWSAQPTANPEPFTQLLGVSCRRSGCMAVGTASPSGSASSLAGLPLAERWTGTKWAALPVPDPLPAGSFAELTSVSCPSASDCVAVGDYQNAAGTADGTLTAHWDGTAWALVPSPSPAKFSGLASVSCPSATRCVAVGGRSRSMTGTASPLVEVWNGTAWTVQSAPR
jgi:hypothetical protein